MEFHENTTRAPFIGFVLLWRTVNKAWRRYQTRRVLERLSDEELKDVGLSRHDY